MFRSSGGGIRQQSGVVEHKGLSASAYWDATFLLLNLPVRLSAAVDTSRTNGGQYRYATLRGSRNRIDVRLDDAIDKAVNQRVKEKRYKSASAYVRHLVDKDLRALPDEDRLAHLESVMGGNHKQVTGALRSIAMVQRAQYALFESAVKAILSYLPDSGSQGRELATARGKERYARVLKFAEQSSFELLEQLSAEVERRSPNT